MLNAFKLHEFVNIFEKITGACVEGGASLAGDRCTLTPLQVSTASNAVDIVALLLSYGANAFLSTQHTDSMCLVQRGCYSSISVAAAHNQRTMLRKLISHPLSKVSRDVLSLEEMLAEGDTCCTRNGMEMQPTLTKSQIKCLQEAMYHSAENNHLGKRHTVDEMQFLTPNSEHFRQFLVCVFPVQILHLNCVHLVCRGHFTSGCSHWQWRTIYNWIQLSNNCCKNFRMSARTTTVHNLSTNAFHCCSAYSAIAR